jgi:hypothetical protein
MNFISLADRVARGTHPDHNAAEWKWIFNNLGLTETQYLTLYALSDVELADFCMGRMIAPIPPVLVDVGDRILDLMIRYESEVLLPGDKA